MTYKDLARTFEILGKYQKNGMDSKCLEMWAEHDEHGIEVDFSTISKDDVVELVEMGWYVGCDGDSPYDEEWNKVVDEDTFKVIDKDALYELVQDYSSIYKYE